MARKKATRSKSSPKEPAKRRQAKAKATHRKAAKKQKRQRAIRGRESAGTLVAFEQRGLGARSGGQSGDTQGLSGLPRVDSESVEELMEEGQSFEAEVLNGIERVPDPDEGEIETEEVPEDDVPEEYQDPDRS